MIKKKRDDYVMLGEFEEIKGMPYENIIEEKEITHYRKLGAKSQEFLTIAILIQFFENMLRESTPQQESN